MKPLRLAVSSVLFVLIGLPVAQAQHLRTSSEVQDETSARMTLDASWPSSLQAALDSASATTMEDHVLTAVAQRGGDVRQLVHLYGTATPTVRVVASDFDEVRLPIGALSPSVQEELSRPLARVEDVGLMRKRPVGTLVVQLVRYDAEREVLRRYRRLTLEIDGLVDVQRAAQRDGMVRSLARGFTDNPHVAVERSALADGHVVRIEVSEEGVYRIDREALSGMLEGSGMSVDDVDPRRLQVFSNGGQPLPALNDAPRPADLIENPALVRGGGDGSFDEGDALVFYADGPQQWHYDAEDDERWEHVTHPFSRTNSVFVKVGSEAGLRVPGGGTFSGTATRITEVEGRLVEDAEQFLWSSEGRGSGMDWTSTIIEAAGTSVTLLGGVTPPGLASGTVRYQVRVAAQSSPSVGLQFVSGGQVLGTVRPHALSAGSENPIARDREGTFEQEVSAGTPLRLAMRLDGGSNPRAVWDYVRAFYPQALRAEDGYLRFATPPTLSGEHDFVLSGFSGTPEVWDVTEPGAIRRVPGRRDGSKYIVRLDLDEGAPREIVAFQPAGERAAPSGVRVPTQNLHGLGGYPDLVVVAPEVFAEQAQTLADRRRAEGLRPLVVTPRELYNEFSGGVPDMRAVRDFMKFLYDRAASEAEMPRYLLLYGDGHFDYRNLTETPLENHVFPYETEETFEKDHTFTSDDYFGLLDDDEGGWCYNGITSRYSCQPGLVERVDIGVGRFPVQTVEDAQAMLNKIVRYESPETRGAWRTRYFAFSDDGYNGLSARLEGRGDLHLRNAEVVMPVVDDLAPGMTMHKAYGPSFERVFTSGGYAIPDMERAVTSQIEQGVLVANYSGHGGPGGLMQENVVTLADVENLYNPDRLPVFITATCSFGRWDLEDQQSGAEALVLNPQGGGVAAFTTVRTVFTSSSTTSLNPGMNRELNIALFSPDEEGRPARLGDALRIAKNTSAGTQGNNRKFNLLGDPSMRFGLPEQTVRVTHLNGEAVTDSTAGHLRALGRVTLRGEVLDLGGTRDAGFSGPVTVSVYDAAREVPLPDNYESSYTYTVREDLLWRGVVQAEGGTFQAQFVVPRDISYRNAPGRIALYARATTSNDDALGATEQVIVGGTAADAPDDDQGPQLSVFLGDTTFVDGGLAQPDADLLVRLFDESGVNVVGAGVGHEMLLTIDGDDAHAVEIGERYEAEPGSYQRGEVRFSLDEYPQELAPGPHTLEVTAWDVLNNSTRVELSFVVGEGEGLEVRHVYNYPNPTSGPTRFFFEHNQPAGTVANVEVRVYTVTGRPVRTLREEALPLVSGPVGLPWDGRDEDGDRVASGVYLYKLRIAVDGAEGDRQVAERLERIALIR